MRGLIKAVKHIKTKKEKVILKKIKPYTSRVRFYPQGSPYTDISVISDREKEATVSTVPLL